MLPEANSFRVTNCCHNHHSPRRPTADFISGGCTSSTRGKSGQSGQKPAKSGIRSARYYSKSSRKSIFSKVIYESYVVENHPKVLSDNLQLQLQSKMIVLSGCCLLRMCDKVWWPFATFVIFYGLAISILCSNINFYLSCNYYFFKLCLL